MAFSKSAGGTARIVSSLASEKDGLRETVLEYVVVENDVFGDVTLEDAAVEATTDPVVEVVDTVEALSAMDPSDVLRKLRLELLFRGWPTWASKVDDASVIDLLNDLLTGRISSGVVGGVL